MANVSNWKGTEKKAAELFPGGRRRTRVGGGTYALLADDVIWGEEYQEGNRVIKKPFREGSGAVYIDAKKKKKSALVTEFLATEKKYKTRDNDRLVLVTQKKNQKRIMVTVDGDFFEELIKVWAAGGSGPGSLKSPSRAV